LGIAASAVGTALIPPPPSSVDDSDQCAMVGEMARHLDAYASESLTVGFPSKEVVALRGDPSPLPPHPPTMGGSLVREGV
jgi:hypothetical protein